MLCAQLVGAAYFFAPVCNNVIKMTPDYWQKSRLKHIGRNGTLFNRATGCSNKN
jgi:hypothetical protein